jgi:hypothetical protein
MSFYKKKQIRDREVPEMKIAGVPVRFSCGEQGQMKKAIIIPPE